MFRKKEKGKKKRIQKREKEEDSDDSSSKLNAAIANRTERKRVRRENLRSETTKSSGRYSSEDLKALREESNEMKQVFEMKQVKEEEFIAIRNDQQTFSNTESTLEEMNTQDVNFETWELEQIKRGGHQTLYSERCAKDMEETAFMNVQDVERRLERRYSDLQAKVQENQQLVERLKFEINEDTIRQSKLNVHRASEAYVWYQKVYNFVFDMRSCFLDKMQLMQQVEEAVEKVKNRYARNRKERLRLDLLDELNIVEQRSKDDFANRDDHGYFLARQKPMRLKRKAKRHAILREKYTPNWCEGAFSDESDSHVEDEAERMQSLKKAADLIFENVHPTFQNSKTLQTMFDDWRIRYPDSYQAAYASDAVKQLKYPFDRMDFLFWDALLDTTLPNPNVALQKIPSAIQHRLNVHSLQQVKTLCSTILQLPNSTHYLQLLITTLEGAISENRQFSTSIVLQNRLERLRVNLQYIRQVTEDGNHRSSTSVQ